MQNEKKQLDENTGILFFNANKKNPNQPDWKGTFYINGSIVDVVGWETISKAGTRYVKLKKDIKKGSDENTAPRTNG